MKSKYDIYIVSAVLTFPASLNAKYNWLKNNFNYIEDEKIVFGNKKIIKGDIMIDDNDFNLEEFLWEKDNLFITA